MAGSWPSTPTAKSMGSRSPTDDDDEGGSKSIASTPEAPGMGDESATAGKAEPPTSPSQSRMARAGSMMRTRDPGPQQPSIPRSPAGTTADGTTTTKLTLVRREMRWMDEDPAPRRRSVQAPTRHEAVQPSPASPRSPSSTAMTIPRGRLTRGWEIGQQRMFPQPSPPRQHEPVGAGTKSRAGVPSMRLDLDLDLEVQIDAKLQGDLTLGILDEDQPFNAIRSNVNKVRRGSGR